MNNLILNNDFFSLMIEQLGVMVITDNQGRYIYVNKAWEEFYNKSIEEIKGKYVRDIFPSTKIDDVLKSKKPIIGCPTPHSKESKKHGFCNYFPLIKNGNIVAVVIYAFFEDDKSIIDFSIRINKMMNELNYYQQELRDLRSSKYSINDIIGESVAIKNLKKQIKLASQTTSNVLIEGETGVGKELVAHSIHDLSSRALKPLIKVNCAAIPSELFESELFGYEYGAFTGAKRGGKQGKFEMADKGSLFLDEINQLPITAQPKLLRVLQEKEVERIAGKKPIKIDARLIVATNVDLAKLVKTKQFREDLYYRLNVINIRIPALRERKDDIKLISDNIIYKLNFQLGLNVEGIDEDVIEKFKLYDWPGNVRELQNVIERGMNLALTGILTWDYFKDYFVNKLPLNLNNKGYPTALTLKEAKIELEKDKINRCLADNNFNKSKTARDLGISRTMLYKKLNKYNIV